MSKLLIHAALIGCGSAACAGVAAATGLEPYPWLFHAVAFAAGASWGAAVVMMYYWEDGR